MSSYIDVVDFSQARLRRASIRAGKRVDDLFRSDLEAGVLSLAVPVAAGDTTAVSCSWQHADRQGNGTTNSKDERPSRRFSHLQSVESVYRHARTDYSQTLQKLTGRSIRILPFRRPDPELMPGMRDMTDSDTTSPVRWGIIGTARIARKVAVAAIRDTPGAELVTVASRSASGAAAWANEHGARRSCGSYEALLADDEIDAVYVSAPAIRTRGMDDQSGKAGKSMSCARSRSRLRTLTKHGKWLRPARQTMSTDKTRCRVASSRGRHAARIVRPRRTAASDVCVLDQTRSLPAE